MTDSKACATAEVPVLESPRAWRLNFRHSGKDRFRVLRRGERLVVGSADSVDISLSDPTISAVHCEVHATASGLRVADLGSKNGLFVGAGRVNEVLLVGPRVGFSIGCTVVEAEERGDRSLCGDLGLIGSSDAMRRVRDSIRRFAPLRAPVLLLGESGTGKDLVAQALHAASGREGTYLPLNIAAVPDTLLDAELFGHRRGAFTGAIADRPGLFSEADGGTLFLDEIAELSPAGQAKLLRVVEDGRVRAVGDSEGRGVDVRLVSATCAPLLERIAEEKFRGDLYHRLSHLVISLPPLRRRVEDIPALAEHYLQRIADDVGRKHLLPSALDVLRRATWPGNVRELFGVLYRAAALTSEEALGPGHLCLPEAERLVRGKLHPERARELLDIHGSSSAAARAAGVPRSTFRSVLERDQAKRRK